MKILRSWALESNVRQLVLNPSSLWHGSAWLGDSGATQGKYCTASCAAATPKVNFPTTLAVVAPFLLAGARSSMVQLLNLMSENSALWLRHVLWWHPTFSDTRRAP